MALFSVDICEECMKFCNENEEQKTTNADFINSYNKLMMRVLKHEFHISKRHAKIIIKTLGYGNWKHLWETEKEAKSLPDEIREELINEIFYCSDRWSWDRVLRVNWLYLRFVSKQETNKTDI